ncbi:MAG: PSP1 C-terminal domain-containing protein [Patescibacteria group bacterium]
METKVNTEEAVKICRTLIEKNKIRVKVLKCEQNEQGLTFFYLTPERSDLRPLSRDLNRQFKVKINFRELTDQEAAALIPGYGPCGTRISWVTGACGHLWDCTCDPTDKTGKDKGTQEVEAPERSKSSDLSGEKDQEGREVDKTLSPAAEPTPVEPVKPVKKPSKKFTRRLVLK